MAKIIKLTEHELHKIVKDATIKILNEQEVHDDLIEYARLKKDKTGINPDIFVDDGGAYKRNGHPLWVYVRNGYTVNDPIFHIDVSHTPVAPNIKYNISDIDLQAVLAFVELNADLLKAFADEEISHLDFYSSFKPIVYSYSMPQTEIGITEMSTLRPKDSGLPTILWIDEGSEPKHGPRIKFKACKDQIHTKEYTSMSISDEPEIFNPPKKYDITSKDLKRIYDFVKLNQKNLLEVCNGLMTYEDFLKIMIKT